MPSNDLLLSPSLGVLAVVIHKGRLLLARRTNEPDAGCWGFPGGYVERGETLAEAAVRELHEETGVLAEARDIIDTIEDIDTEKDGRVAHHFVLVALRCEWISGEPKAGSDVNSVRWTVEADLEDGDLFVCKGLHRIAAKAGFFQGETPTP